MALPEYKAQRAEMPELMRPQLDEIVSYLEAARVASFCRDGIEAVVLIACLARRAESRGWETVISSADKDFMQLVSPRIGLLNRHRSRAETVWDPTSRHYMGQDGRGARSRLWIGWSLMGDAVDNISGVPGVGPKTAAWIC